MNSIWKIVAQRTRLFGLPAFALWAIWQKFSERPIKPRIAEVALFGAAMSVYLSTVFQASSRLGYPKLMTQIAPALGYGCIALTFEGGPCEETTPLILATLREAGAKATFFVLLDQVAKYPELARQISAEGHTIGLYGKDSEPMALLSIRQIVHSLKMMQRELGDDLPKPRYFRPPHGFKSHNIQEAVNRMGMTMITWSVDPKDSRARDSDQLVTRILKHTTHWDIVRLSDGNSLTATTLPTILQRLKGRGYRLIRL